MMTEQSTPADGALRSLIRYGYVPFMLIALNGAAIALVAYGAPYWTLALVLGAAIGAAFLAERLLPFHDDWNHSHGDGGRDVAHAVVYEISNLNSILLLPLIAWFIPWDGIWPTEWPFALQVLIAVVVADFGFSMLHWLSHRVTFLWRLHAVHHSLERLYGFNGLVRHPLHQTIDLAIGTLPLVLAGLPVDVAVVLGAIISIQLIVQHSNVDFAIGPVQKFLSIGTLHRLHHVNWGKEGDVNFGLFFTVWDWMLGTLVLQPKRAIEASDMGIDEEPNYPRGYVDHLIHPFSPRTDDLAISAGQRTKVEPAE
ncbi:MAG: sterol desaturase family protein [Pseudomonadota bacterium]